MKKINDSQFNKQLAEIIADIEQSSQIEIVVIIKKQSAHYHDVPLLLSSLLSFSVLALLLFIDTLFDEFIIYSLSLVSFALSLFISAKLPALQNLLLSKKRKQRNVEIMARALFQKGGLHHTRTEIGTLIYCSLLEQTVYVVADRGAQMALPAQEWQLIDTNLQTIFKTNNPKLALLKQLANCKQTFKRYIPALANNSNELADNLSIDL